MRSELVDIYSDESNAVVLRQQGRKFPGILIQGDTLYSLCQQADIACTQAKDLVASDVYYEIDDLRNRLWDYLNHYKIVLEEHQIPLPFSETAGA